MALELQIIFVDSDTGIEIPFVTPHFPSKVSEDILRECDYDYLIGSPLNKKVIDELEEWFKENEGDSHSQFFSNLRSLSPKIVFDLR